MFVRDLDAKITTVGELRGNERKKHTTDEALIFTSWITMPTLLQWEEKEGPLFKTPFII